MIQWGKKNAVAMENFTFKREVPAVFLAVCWAARFLLPAIGLEC